MQIPASTLVSTAFQPRLPQMMTEVSVSLRVLVGSWHPLLGVAARTVYFESD